MPWRLDEAKALNAELRRRAAAVQLLGEVQLSDRELDAAVQALRGLRGTSNLGSCPTLLAVTITEIAARTSDGHKLWEHVRERLGLADSSTAYLRKSYLSYLQDERLPDFEHLVLREHAMRYRTRVLAHAMVPLPLVPRFMERVIWPALTNPALHGGSGDEIQQRLVRNPVANAQIPEAVQRFIVYGGRSARDFIDRCLVYSDAVVSRRPDSGHGLAPWLRDALREWLKARQWDSTPLRSQQRLKPPALAFEPGLRRVLVTLPYQDRRDADLTWVVTVPGRDPAEYPATLPAWQRIGPREEHVLDEPFAALHVALLDNHQRQVAAWPLPALTPAQPALFFSTRTGRARSGGEFLEGDHWWVVRPDSLRFETDGELLCLERAGRPEGAWHGFAAECVGVERGTWLRADRQEYRLVREAPVASIVRLHPLPAHLGPLEDAVLGLEDELPRVLIPQGRDRDDQAYLRVWQLSVRGESGESRAAGPAELGAQYDADRRGWLVPLEELIPDEDVGSWQLEVSGPMGQGLTTRLDLLPRMAFDVPPGAAISGAGEPRTVRVLTNGEFEVLEARDVATRVGDEWLLEDRNRNGRIPFTIRDPRSDRETTAAFAPPTVRWRWIARGRALGRQGSLALSLADLKEQQDLALEVEAPPGARVAIELVARDEAEPLMSVPVPPGQSRVLARQFVDTVSASGHIHHQLVLALESGAGSRQEVATAAIFEQPRVTGLEAAIDGDDLVLRWRQDHQDGRLSARLVSEWRPWDDPIDGIVDACAAEQWEARFAGLAWQRGRFRFSIHIDDPWLGQAEIYHRNLTLPDANGSYLRSLPRNAEGLLERALATAGDGGLHLAALGKLIAPSVVEADWLLATFETVLARPLTDRWAALDWSELELALSTTGADVVPFIEALSRTVRSDAAKAFVRRLGVARWRSAWKARDRVSPATRGALWSLWEPLGAVFDLARDTQDAGDRCLDYLHARPTTRDEAVACAGLVTAMPAPPVCHASPMALTEDGWQACLAATRRRIAAARRDPAVLSELERLRGQLGPRQQQVRASFPAQFHRDPCLVREDPGRRDLLAPLLAMSLAFAISARLACHGITAPEAPGAEARLRELLPELHARDLCVAEALVALKYPDR